jgi:hypothetical protein
MIYNLSSYRFSDGGNEDAPISAAVAAITLFVNFVVNLL